MAAADILFLSDERLWAPPQDCARELLGRYRMRAAILGRGADGALLAERDRAPLFLPAASTRPVVNTVGAGDALLSSFTHHWLRGMAMEDALRRAIVFASWKIGEKGAAAGFLDEAGLDALCRERGA
jgi:ribokinase